MILPIFAYGQPVLKKVGEPISADYPGLEELVENMWQTMYKAHGVGLAAPQIGLSIRLFVVDTLQVQKDKEAADKVLDGFKKVFINPVALEESGDAWKYEEGCLSIPDVRGEVERLSEIRIKYQDLEFNWHEETFTGLNARVIQHEYDHIEGRLFVEKLKPLKKRLVQRKLDMIKVGKVDADYKLKFVKA
jgi:peptide deformylase